MANTSTSTIENHFIDIFEGKNFQLWKWQMEMILKDKGLFAIANRDENYQVDKNKDPNSLSVDEKNSIEAFLSKDTRAYSTICLNLRGLPARHIKSVSPLLK